MNTGKPSVTDSPIELQFTLRVILSEGKAGVEGSPGLQERRFLGGVYPALRCGARNDTQSVNCNSPIVSERRYMYYDSVILSLLMIKPMHGYEIKKSLEDFNKRVNGSEISNNTLYPLLSRYEKNGIATKQTVTQEGKPNRFQYAVTDYGREYFYKNLNVIDKQTITNRDEFFMKLSFFPVLTPANRKKLLDQREVYIKNSIGDQDSFNIPEALTTFFDMEANVSMMLPFYNRLEQDELDLIAYYRKRIDNPCLVPEEFLPLID